MTYDHTENKRIYCEDWIETDRPWERWEFKNKTGDTWCPCVDHPSWCASTSYRRIDPYAELKKAAQDPTKQIRLLNANGEPSIWMDAGELGWRWTYPPEEYEVRDKPKAMDKPKTVKYLCYEFPLGSLGWIKEGKNNLNESFKRMPQFDMELT